jgi:predicted Rossmann fold nucleotide-binding protein DprA/Smf involved in DNA uptake
LDLSPYVPSEVELIISGGASGVEALAEAYAHAHRITKLILRPHYKRFGKGAPIRRNREMVELADRVVAVWDGSSRGTAGTVAYAHKLKKEVTVVTVELPS